MVLSEQQRARLLQELKDFHHTLMGYSDLVQAEMAGSPTDVDETRLLGLDLQKKYGSLREVIREHGGRGIVLLHGGNYECDVFVEMFSYKIFAPEALHTVMSTAIATVGMAIGKMENLDLCGVPDDGPPMVPPEAFIAHGGSSDSLRKLTEFLRALGVNPLVVEDQASEDRSANENVEHYLRQADCAIVLATKGDIDGKTGNFLPRGNVLVEAGRFQERFEGRIIYLLEEGATLPSNIREKVWESFTQGNMERAFMKVGKEFTAFGIIKTARPGK